CVLQRFLEALALLDVEDDGRRLHGPPLVVAEYVCGDMHPARRTVLADVAFLGVVPAAGVDERLQHALGIFLPILGMIEIERAHLQELFPAVAGDLAVAVVDADDAPRRVHLPGADRDAVEEAAEVRFALAQRTLRLALPRFAIGDVDQNRRRADQRLRRVLLRIDLRRVADR